MRGNFFFRREFGKDFFGQYLAQFHAPLVEAEHIQDNALGKDFVLIHRNQASQRPRRQLPEQDGIGWTITFKHPERRVQGDFFLIHAIGGQFFLNFFNSLALHEGLGLRKEVRQQLVVVIAKRIVADGRRNEVTRNDLRALVYELVESMLPIRAGLTPNDGTGLIRHRLTIAVG